MYREIIIRAYSEEEIAQIDLIRSSGINLTELVLDLLMTVNVKPKKKRNLKPVA